VTQIICGVDVSSTSLAASIGRSGAAAIFANIPAGIVAKDLRCQQFTTRTNPQVRLVGVEGETGKTSVHFTRTSLLPPLTGEIFGEMGKTSRRACIHW
jgi:hypothetical protein